MRTKAIEAQKLCKKSMLRAFKALNNMAKVIGESKLTKQEEIQIAKNLEKYRLKIEKKYGLSKPEDNNPI